MAEIPMPDGDLEDVQIELDQNFQVNRSQWTGRRRVSGMPGAQKWTASASVNIATEDEERPWRLFFLKLRGPVNRFRFPVACSQRVGANPTVRDGGSPFTTLLLANLPASSIALLAGQFMTVPLPSGHHRLVMLTEDLVSDAAGQGTATFVPELMETPATGTAVETVAPYMHAAFDNSKQGWKTSNGVTAFVLSTEEAL